jgi:hypothetical protein
MRIIVHMLPWCAMWIETDVSFRPTPRIMVLQNPGTNCTPVVNGRHLLYFRFFFSKRPQCRV